MKIVINTDYGGFGLSHKRAMRYAELKGIKLYGYNWDTRTGKLSENGNLYFTLKPVKCIGDVYKNQFYPGAISRNDPALVQTVEELGERADDHMARLKVVEVPDDVKWTIVDNDGKEHVAEVHRTWS